MRGGQGDLDNYDSPPQINKALNGIFYMSEAVLPPRFFFSPAAINSAKPQTSERTRVKKKNALLLLYILLLIQLSAVGPESHAQT